MAFCNGLFDYFECMRIFHHSFCHWFWVVCMHQMFKQAHTYTTATKKMAKSLIVFRFFFYCPFVFFLYGSTLIYMVVVINRSAITFTMRMVVTIQAARDTTKAGERSIYYTQRDPEEGGGEGRGGAYTGKINERQKTTRNKTNIEKLQSKFGIVL